VCPSEEKTNLSTSFLSTDNFDNNDVSTNNFNVSNVEWNPPTIAGIAVYIWPYIIVGLWHFMTAAGKATSVKVFPICLTFNITKNAKSKL
jgi:hypothetical protein